MATTETTDHATLLTERLASPSEAFGETSPDAKPAVTMGHLRAWTRGQLVRISFWSAVLLPVLYVPLLLGTDVAQEFVLGLIAAHVAALIGGRTYHRPSPK